MRGSADLFRRASGAADDQAAVIQEFEGLERRTGSKLIVVSETGHFIHHGVENLAMLLDVLARSRGIGMRYPGPDKLSPDVLNRFGDLCVRLGVGERKTARTSPKGCPVPTGADL